ncbi:elongation factor P maturation arginine rhamnosyltransferase EarP [Pelomonas sp. CA6]|uniref:elongation factor P maturation arginine rhamnosyltransferase EarP n=1 Tax=Pelomonas sp. CA6 TaxID=2907999 RepID=UPI001F4C27FE|nr:elongation factor P maturation arginine rhamnosyltransferase EarP [Pelomonas sp. CA6]MCH7344086.1 elongation factor P maturation arginine rhamnosyltransferase EarP [Pelomonas sp. CA6]
MPSPLVPVAPAPRRWDFFCRVIDNHGDLGVDLRLARELAQRGHAVRLWCDDLSALGWMQPAPVPGLDCRPWAASESADPAEVVLETFGCELPPAYLQRMAQARVAPTWINLEYLSAEPYVERSHGLRSPQFSGPGAGLQKWFFYPGFTPRTGGLPRETGLLQARAAHDGAAWLTERGWAPEPGERVLMLFAYPHAPLRALLDALPGRWLLLLCPGDAQTRVPALLRPGQRCLTLPYLSQQDFDRLLWSCDLNLVRGEDSFVRAQWAAAPMLWHIYHQDDGAHGPKLRAWLDLAWAGAPAALRQSWQALALAWNGLGPWNEEARRALHQLPEAARQQRRWRDELAQQAPLAEQLCGFVARKHGISG